MSVQKEVLRVYYVSLADSNATHLYCVMLLSDPQLTDIQHHTSCLCVKVGYAIFATMPRVVKRFVLHTRVQLLFSQH